MTCTVPFSSSLFTVTSSFFTDPAPSEIYTLSLHDALPICVRERHPQTGAPLAASGAREGPGDRGPQSDRKSTRLNSSHVSISYAVFCLKKKNTSIKTFDGQTHVVKLHCARARTQRTPTATA